ncbi:protein terminal ear1 homolog [Malania oleifera]|uniref:protein terminal ear1 homolog n=1 Tax=Malania oleifera TaxID=397392 RepID=UPI0025AEBB39|nr:protein terminal ear1 homolog [Malania oleifera]
MKPELQEVVPAESSMAGKKKGLNPEAPEFIPSSSFLFFPQSSMAASDPPNFFLHQPQPLITGTAPLSFCYYHLPDLLNNSFLYSPNSLPPETATATAAAIHSTPAPPATEERCEVGRRAVTSERSSDGHRRRRPEGLVIRGRPTTSSRLGRSYFVWRRGGGGRRGEESGDGEAGNGSEYGRRRTTTFRKQSTVNVKRKQQSRESGVEPVEKGGRKTTAMIRNIPNKYTREMLVQFLDEHCMLENRKMHAHNSEDDVSAFDFVYLPIDFATGCNKGYAFVNFTNPSAVWKFQVASHNQSWEHFQSSKIRQIACAKIQGKEALVNHFQSSRFACDSEDFLPACFSPPRDGSRRPVTMTTVGRLSPTPPRTATENNDELKWGGPQHPKLAVDGAGGGVHPRGMDGCDLVMVALCWGWGWNVYIDVA